MRSRGGRAINDPASQLLGNRGRSNLDSCESSDRSLASAIIRGFPIRKLMDLTKRFEKALVFACQAHAGQLRKGTKIPYIVSLQRACVTRFEAV